MKFKIICIFIAVCAYSSISMTKYKVQYDKDQKFENPYPLEVISKENAIGVVFKDFFANKKKGGAENYFIIIDKKNLKSEIVDQKKFLLVFPTSTGKKEVTFKTLFEKPTDKIENTGEKFEAKNDNCKDDMCEAFEFTIGSTKLKITSAHAPSHDQVITHAFKNNDEVWICGIENMAVNDDGIIGRGGFGIYSIDLKKKDFQPTTDAKVYFDATWISLISEDKTDKNLIWIGNNLGLYAVDRSFKEKYTCIQVLDKVGNLKDLKCFKNQKNMIKRIQAEDLLSVKKND